MKKSKVGLIFLIIAVVAVSLVPVNTLADNGKVRHMLVRVFSADVYSNTIRAETILDLPYHDTALIDREKLYGFETSGKFEVYSVSGDSLIYIDSVRRALSDVKPETYMVVTVENNVVTRMTGINSVMLQKSGIFSGILEENNPDLGYITLYFPDGSGTSPGLKGALSYYRTYSYLRVEDVLIYKNGRTAGIEELNPGDSVFIKLDNDGNIEKISGTDNFYPVYGKVRTKGNWVLQVERNDGFTVLYRVTPGTPVFKDKRIASWNDIKAGDEVRILLQTSGNQTIIGEITVKSEEVEVDAVYRADFSYYDRLTNSIIVSNMVQFRDGTWNRTSLPIIRKLDINSSYVPDIPKGVKGTVYIATGKNITGRDSVVWLSFDSNGLRTEITGDTVISADPGGSRLTLMNRNIPVTYDDTSIIVKKGRLLSPGQVKSRDEAYFVTSSQTDGTVRANVIWIREPLDDTGLTLIRGRISQIDLFSSMTLESFSEFSEPDWEFYNVQKTLTIDPSVTRVFDDGGRTDLELFDDTGTESFKKRTVYVLTQDGKALLVSTAPFGDVVYRGRIYDLPGVQKDSFNHVVVPASSVIIKEGIRYDGQLTKWVDVPEAQFSFLPNTVFIRNGKIADPSMLEAGDRITVIKSENGDNAFVVMAESY